MEMLPMMEKRVGKEVGMRRVRKETEKSQSYPF